MPREKLYERKTDTRTARVFVIACEGQYTETLYFTALAEGLRRVRVIPLPAIDGHSAPDKIMERLNEFAVQRGLFSSWKQRVAVSYGWCSMSTVGLRRIVSRQLIACSTKQHGEATTWL